jgi:hypothetical protein
MEGKKPRFKVLCPIKGKDDKTHWAKMGVGFTNRDGSTNVILDGLPVNGKLQIRDYDEDDDRKPERGQDALPF